MLRQELQPPPLDIPTVDRLEQLAEQIVDAIDSGTDHARLIAEFNTATGQSYDSGDFDGAAGSMPMRDFVESALTEAPRITGITHNEFIEIIERLMRAEGSERERLFYLQLLERSLPHPRISELIYHSEHKTPAEIMENALRYRAFEMPPPT